MSPDSSSIPSEAAASDTRVIWVLAGAGMTVSVMQTIVIPLIPSFPTLFNTDAASASWVITATLLVAAVSTPVMGRLGDMFGKKRMLLICMGFLAGSAVVCALSTSLPVVVFGRGVQGLGIGAIPLGISLMRDIVAPARLGSGVALMSSSLGAGGALALPVAAFIADRWGWSALFWFAAALGSALGALVAVGVPESPVRRPGSVDLVGVGGLAVGMGSLLLAISKGGSWGWGSATILGLFAISVVVLAMWGAWELRVEAPIVDLRTTASRPVLMTNLASVMAGFSMYAMNLLAPQMLQLPEVTGYGLGKSVLAAGLWMAPGGLLMVAMSQAAAKLAAERGAKMSLLAGVLIICAGNVLAQVLLTSGSAWSVLLFASIVSVGVAFAYAAMPTLIMENVPLSETAAANGFNSLARSFGTSTASAVIGVVLAQMTVTIGDHVLPSESGMRTTLVICTVSALLAAALTWAIPARSPRHAHS
ncbi:MAG: MFS transporter [Microthrixaceae bacterium]|nr:MFS transporter [Microthrixaceae bacterium]MCO5313257.1 MFS transporter [Microthrixaceae bacterium]